LFAFVASVDDGDDPIAALLEQAERKAGAMLAEMSLPTGPRKYGSAMEPTLDDLGIDKKQSHRWQRAEADGQQQVAYT
jgi:hypothetical protein